MKQSAALMALGVSDHDPRSRSTAEIDSRVAATPRRDGAGAPMSVGSHVAERTHVGTVSAGAVV